LQPRVLFAVAAVLVCGFCCFCITVFWFLIFCGCCSGCGAPVSGLARFDFRGGVPHADVHSFGLVFRIYGTFVFVSFLFLVRCVLCRLGIIILAVSIWSWKTKKLPCKPVGLFLKLKCYMNLQLMWHCFNGLCDIVLL